MFPGTNLDSLRKSHIDMLIGGMTTIEILKDAVDKSIDLSNVFDGVSYNIVVNKLQRYRLHDNSIQ